MRPEDVARSWIGTPYVHQASCRGGGADCLGLLRGVWREMMGAEPEAVPAYTADWDEALREEHLWAAARRHLREIWCSTSAHTGSRPAQLAPGDVVLFRMRAGAVAKHLGIIGRGDPAASFIHSFTGHGVVESPLSGPWRRRIVAVFAFPRTE